MCAGREFQVEGADTEKAREEKLLAILIYLFIYLFIFAYFLTIAVRLFRNLPDCSSPNF